MKDDLFKCLILLMIVSLATCSLMAQAEVKIMDEGGNTATIIVSEQGKMYFSPDTMFINDGNGQHHAFAIADIRRVNFNANLVDIPDCQELSDLQIYPNPAGNFFRIKSSDANPLKVRLYAMNGRLLKEELTQSGERINISDLPAGMYLVQVNNTTFKLSKK